ncbi:MAG: TetR/AcrR family transcriptional regulator [Leptospiraceae bacterium]|nr:TetR/AcrR family transcriptional regulator [Leptospiraceae bacterium]MCP5499817.1 TetR/AcrR family transcriptional regulator [Leptospiraceae bacterium]
MKIIKERGFYDFSMRDIAKQLGVSHGAIYKHFQNKEALFAELSTQGFELLTSELNKTLEKCPPGNVSSMEAIARMYIRFGIEYSEYYRLMFSGIINSTADYPDLEAASQRSYNTFKRAISSLIDKGFIPSLIDANLLTFYSWAFLHGLISLVLDKRLQIAFPPGYNLQNLMESLEFLIQSGLSLLNLYPKIKMQV